MAIVFPALTLLAVEGVLRLLGTGYPTSFCLARPGEAIYTDNDRFLFQFYSPKTNLRPNPFAVAIHKPAETVRIVIVGESAAAGTPEPAYSFGRILERMLQDQFPQKHIELISAAMRGVNSHILLPAIRDCARLQPDLFVVYMGNNEAVGLYAPGPHSGRLTSHLRLLRLLQWVSATYVGQLFQPLLLAMTHEGVAAANQDAVFFEGHRVSADDHRRKAVYDNFRNNLADICSAARRTGAGVVLMTVSANLKDCPPFGSLHRAGISNDELTRWEASYHDGVVAEGASLPAAAITNYSLAAAKDDHFAELHFRLARCYYNLGQIDTARAEFVLARDWDALQFRADSRLNTIIREVAAQARNPNIRLADAERALADSEPDHIPGGRLFRDHVHPSFDGDYELARTAFPAAIELLAAKLPIAASQNKPTLSREQCATRLAFTRLNEAQIASSMLQVTSFPPFTSQLEHAQRQQEAEHRVTARFGDVSRHDLEVSSEVYRAAMRLYPDDWWLPYSFARLLLTVHDCAGALEPFRAARQLLPHWLDIRVGLSSALCCAGRYDEALQELNQARAMDPQSEAVKVALRQCKLRLKKARRDDGRSGP